MKVHFSIDDVGLQLYEAAQAGSLFEVPFFKKLKEWHDGFGLCTTCYCFAMLDGWIITELPRTLRADFKACRRWLKFGFHSKRNFAFAEESGYEAGWELMQSAIKKLGMGTTKTLRLHNWDATTAQKQFLYRKGVRVLLSKDDDSLPLRGGGVRLQTLVCRIDERG